MNLVQWIKYRIELKRRKKGVCKYCYGKGYSTQLRGTTAFADFPRDKTYHYPQKIEKNPCRNCKKLTKSP